MEDLEPRVSGIVEGSVNRHRWFAAVFLVLVLSCSSAVVKPEWVDTAKGRAVRVGSGVDAPRVIGRVAPDYPAADRKNGISGFVKLDIVIDETGRVIQGQVLEAPSVTLGEAAQDAVAKWRFLPTTIEGQRVKVLFTITINFKVD